MAVLDCGKLPLMTERLLQYIWQLQYFNRNDLFTEQGDPLRILHPGIYNRNQGPDFLEARIALKDTLWAGNIELHLRTSDWKKHAHHKDARYRNIVLHVVWENDREINALFDLPTLELKGRVSGLLLRKYSAMMKHEAFVPCEKHLGDVPSIVWTSWKERLLLERLQRKSLQVWELLKENNFNWEEALWWITARNFGAKVNAAAFECIARSVPYRIIRRHRNQIHQLEALLLGQAGLLEQECTDSYAKLLQREYRFLKNKYQLKPAPIPVLFLRMRPQGFPSLRLAQLAMFISTVPAFFSLIKECIDLKDIRRLLQVTANDYWNEHYRPGERSPFRHKQVGSGTADAIVINAVIPLLYCYSAHHGITALEAKMFRWAGELPAEKNHIIHAWKNVGVALKSASCSQALLELKTRYCDHKKCLDCAVGNSILKRQPDPPPETSLMVD